MSEELNNSVFPDIASIDVFCPATFDGWGCWDATAAGEVAEIPCPSDGNASRKVRKRCSENGYWEINLDTKKRKWITGISGTELYCPRTFDGWGCWNDTLAGKTAYIPCPQFITGFLPERSAHKECNPDGTWYRHPDTNRTWSNYTTCVDKEDLTYDSLQCSEIPVHIKHWNDYIILKDVVPVLKTLSIINTVSNLIFRTNQIVLV
ncbi:calcitonin receptor [Trichonephila clavata]|uniref:Calcitonin receptor n=1 Tax=Trichonephila clavata TaxID=2740835 RepID=A0A8X6GX36_TRICU|nr:calcitonin receptor [Trichonephila clavata]